MCCDWRTGHTTLSRATVASLVKNTLVFVVPIVGTTWAPFGTPLTLKVFFVMPRFYPQFMIHRCYTPSSEEPLGFGAGIMVF